MDVLNPYRNVQRKRDAKLNEANKNKRAANLKAGKPLRKVVYEIYIYNYYKGYCQG